MKKKTTAGERIAFSVYSIDDAKDKRKRKALARRIDRAIRAAVRVEHFRMYDIGWRVSHSALTDKQIHDQLSAKPAKKKGATR